MRNINSRKGTMRSFAMLCTVIAFAVAATVSAAMIEDFADDPASRTTEKSLDGYPYWKWISFGNRNPGLRYTLDTYDKNEAGGSAVSWTEFDLSEGERWDFSEVTSVSIDAYDHEAADEWNDVIARLVDVDGDTHELGSIDGGPKRSWDTVTFDGGDVVTEPDIVGLEVEFLHSAANSGEKQYFEVRDLEADGATLIPEPSTLLPPIPGSDGGGVEHSFRITAGEVPVEAYVEFLNAADSAGDITITDGEVSDAATGDRYCLTSEAAPDAYAVYDADAPLGERFTAAPDKSEHPMIFVSWFGAAAYCNWKSAQDGLVPVYDPAAGWTADMSADGYRLPTEEEWYKAAAWDPSSETYTAYGNGSDTAESTEINHLHSGDDFEDNPVATTPVTNYKLDSSYYGLYDASGNVWEWCHSFLNDSGSDQDVDPHAVRGGSWGNLKEDTRTESRCGFKPHMAVSTVGFRYVTTAEQSQ